MASYEELRSYARIIRNETKSSANTALRIGEMYLNIIDKMEDVDDRFKDFLTGTDTDNIINRWKELESFLNGYTETATLADLLSVKADKATTLAGYGITNAYTKTEVDNKITSVNTSVTTLQTTVSGNTTSINSLQNTVSGHTSSITSINSKITTLQSYFTNGVANSALRLSGGAEYKAWGQVFFKDGKPVNVSGEGTFTQVNADSVLLRGKARLSYDTNLNALLLTRDDGTAVHFLASGAVATRGLGEIEEGGGGTGTGVDLLNVPSDIIPIVGGTYSLGSSANAWKMIYANGGLIGNTYIDSARVIFGTYIQGQSWVINPDGSATFSSLTINGANAATQNWVNSQDFVKASDLTSINNSISSLQQSTFTGANNPEGYTLTWFTQSGGGRNVTIPAYGEVGTVATDGLAGIGQNVALVDQWLIADLMDYIAEVAAGGNVDLSNYVTLNSAQTISGMKTFTGGITASHLYSVEYLDSSELIINAEKVNFTYYGDDADVQIGLINGYKPLTLGNTSFSPALTSGTVIGTITIGGESKTIFAPNGGSADLSNYVTLDSEQTITGSKYFRDLNSNSIYLQGFELKPYSPDGGIPDRLMYDGYVLLDEYNYKDYLVGDLDILSKGLQESSPLYDLSYLDYIRNYVSGKNLSVVVYNQNSESESINAASVALNVGNSANRVFRLISYKWGDLYWQKGNGNGDGWDSMRTILDSSNYATHLDSAYIKKSGDTVTGQITSTVADGTAPFVVASKTEVANLHSATATKLHTPRTLWGQSFDGSGNVSGNLTEVGSITASNLLTLSSTNHDIYLKRGGADTAALYLGKDNFRPFVAANGLLDLGASNARWKVIYGQSLDLSGDATVRGVLGVKGVTPTINFYYNNATSRTAFIQEVSAGSLKFVGYNNPLKLLLDLQDATAKFYSVELEGSSVGREMVALQTSFDSQDPETSDRPTNHESRCNLLIQPRGGQVYVGYTPTSRQNDYALNVSQKLRLYGDKNANDIPELLFYRDGVSSWKIMNNGGNLIFQNNYTTAVQSSYFDVLKLNCNSGNATLKGSLTTGGNILPSTSNGANIGQSDRRWLNGYIDNLYSDVISADTLTSSTSPYLSVTAASLDLMSCELYGYDSDGNANWNIASNGIASLNSVVISSNDYVHNINGNADGELVIWPSEYLVIENDTITDYAITCSKLVQTSDIRYKNILSNVHLKLSDIAAAPTFKFSWANETDGSTHIGTSSQYWQEIAGELVTENKKTGKLGLDYSTAALVSAVSIAREVNTMKMWQTTTTDRIEELEEKVKKLEEENKELRELLNKK